MHILIDTNTLFADTNLSSEKHNLFVQYVKRTDSKVFIPAVVFSEVEAHTERLYAKSIAEFQKLSASLNLTLEEKIVGHNFPPPAKLTKVYMEKLLERYAIRKGQILPVKSTWAAEMVRRAVRRERPFGEAGQQFRDGLIWLSMLHLKARGLTDVTFISTNTKDFGPSTGNLHQELAKEAEAAGLNIAYFTSLDDFLRANADKIAFITPEYIRGILPIELINSSTLNYLERHSTRLEEYAMHRDNNATGSIEVTNVDLDLDDFYVYTTGADQFAIFCTYLGEVELSVELERLEEDELDPGHDVWKPGYRYMYTDITVEAELTLQGKELKGWEIASWSRY